MPYVEGRDLFPSRLISILPVQFSDFSCDWVMILAQGWNCTKDSRPAAWHNFVNYRKLTLKADYYQLSRNLNNAVFITCSVL